MSMVSRLASKIDHALLTTSLLSLELEGYYHFEALLQMRGMKHRSRAYFTPLNIEICMMLMTALATRSARCTPARMYACVFGFVWLSVSTRALLSIRWTSYCIRLYIGPGFPK